MYVCQLVPRSTHLLASTSHFEVLELHRNCLQSVGPGFGQGAGQIPEGSALHRPLPSHLPGPLLTVPADKKTSRVLSCQQATEQREHERSNGAKFYQGAAAALCFSHNKHGGLHIDELDVKQERSSAAQLVVLGRSVQMYMMLLA